MKYLGGISTRKHNFKAWLINEKTICEVDKIYFGLNKNVEAIDCFYSCKTREFHKGEFILLEYTGLRDKNGKEIYEGDIVTTPRKDLCEVCFIAGAFLLKILNTKCTEYYIHDFIKFDRTEIKGNIYENPEFLGGIK